ncbi:phthioceranic/hydroxyphthioceranic acid synthase [Kutzneria viridogrisea]|uniref:Epothilone polyketide synthase D n=1 Tax=Kutzneria viridogrisea TaxID=47990 RepID=A0ABR6BAL6_9PSEU|nr:epothilone polyketide synthase D [Kutzneria viridogrisea]
MPGHPTRPIAIIGMSCRLPGANGVAELWSLLTNGVDAIREVPPSRFDIDRLWDPDPDAVNKIATRRLGTVDEVDGFDAAFFGIAPREATGMDPQQRLLLEVMWEALEDAAMPPERLPAGRTGVFTGTLGGNYWELLTAAGNYDVYAIAGNSRGGLSGRLSHVLDLRGPSFTVDTACSSGLVALHLACQSLRTEESEVALVGATNLVLNEHESIAYSQSHMLSPDGRCKFSSVHANGFIRSEGVVALVIKPLDAAERDGDPIHAVIHGSAVTNDGRSGGAMVSPGVAGQVAAIRAAYAGAGVELTDVGYVEAHGTGTAVGDPVELTALGQVFGPGRAADNPLRVGSIKTNIGHTEATAGLAGLVKTVLCLRHRMLPPSLYAEEPNPKIDWANLPIRVQTELARWPSDAEVLYAGVNSFGIHGTDAHVVLGSAPVRPRPEPAYARPGLLPLSARSPQALRDLAQRYHDFLAEENTDLTVADLCHTASTGRAHHQYRLATTGDSLAALREQLGAFLTDEPATGLHSGQSGAARLQVVFVFPGQGSQWIGMARELRVSCPTFAATLAECSAAVQAEAGWSVLDVVAGDGLETAGIDVVQPTLWAIEVALAAQWRYWGVVPDVVVGHSLGEIAAACVAGALTVAEAATVICRRSRLLTRVVGKGDMMLVGLAVADAEKAIGDRTDKVSVAVSNGPTATVLAGDPEALREILAELTEREVYGKQLKIPVASHSPQMDPLRINLLEALHALEPAVGEVPVFSTVRGEIVPGDELGPKYWADNLREPVRFADAVTALLANGPTVFVECSPHPILTAAVEECAEVAGATAITVGSTKRNEPELATMLAGLGAVYCAGSPVDWPTLSTSDARRVGLATYPWQHQRFWLTPTQAPTSRQHPLLGAAVVNGPDTYRFEGTIAPAALAYLAEHQVEGIAVLPATGHMEMVHTAAVTALGITPMLTDITFRRAVYLTGANPTIRLDLNRAGEGWKFEVSSTTDGSAWTKNVTGKVVADPGEPVSVPPMDQVRARCVERWAGEEFYARYASVGNYWLGSFQGIESLHLGDGEAESTVRIPPEVTPFLGQYLFHPAVLDAAAQLSAVVSRGMDEVAPFFAGGIERARFLGRPRDPMWTYAHSTPEADGTVRVDMVVTAEDGTPLAELGGFRLRYLDTLQRSAPAPDPVPAGLHELRWRAVPNSTSGPAPVHRWLVVDDGSGLAAGLAASLPGQADLIGREDLRRRLAADPAIPAGIVYFGHTGPGPDATAVTQAAAVATTLATSDTLPPVRLWLVTRGAIRVTDADRMINIGQSAVWGLGRSLAPEQPEWRTSLIDLAATTAAEQLPALLAELTGGDEPQVALRAGTRYVPRLIPLQLPDPVTDEDQALGLTAPGSGSVSDLALRAVREQPPAPHEVQIAVSHASISFRDVLAVTDPSRTGTAQLGCDCVGTITAVGGAVHGLRVGDKVVATPAHGAMATKVTVDAHLVHPMPAGMLPEEAATLPSVLLSAYYGLHEVARLRHGERVLVHTGTGGVGMAAIQVARWLGAEIYATAGSASKCRLLTMFGVEHVFDSRTTEFAEKIKVLTNGDGVDVILNTLSGNAVSANLSVLADSGRYVDLTKHRLEGELPGNASYTVVDILRLGDTQPKRAGRLLREVFRLVQAGVCIPLPHKVFDVADAGSAFDTVARAEHTGKVVLSFTGTRPGPARRVGTGRLSADAAYLVTGGLGGLGLAAARWLAGRGARHLVLFGRTPLRPTDQVRINAIQDLERAGVAVHYEPVDVADETAVRAALQRLRTDGVPEVRGVVHTAGVLDVRSVGEMNDAAMANSLAPKLAGGWVLHTVFADTPLDFFVLYSSGSAIIGSPMIGGYAAGNAALDGLAWHRRSMGLPALSVNWGAWSEAGMAARYEKQHGRSLLPLGASSFTPEEGLAALGALLDAGLTQATLYPADWNRWAAAYPDLAPDPVLLDLLPRSTAPARAAHVAGPAVPSKPVTPVASPESVAPVVAPQPQADAMKAPDMEEFLVGRMARAMGLAPAELDLHRPLSLQGLDSLMATEVRTQLQKTHGVLIPITRMLSGTSLAELAAEATATHQNGR